MRHDRARPKAVVRRFEANPPYYRVVTWAARSEDRKLIGRYRSLEAADEAVLVDSPGAISSGAQRGERT